MKVKNKMSVIILILIGLALICLLSFLFYNGLNKEKTITTTTKGTITLSKEIITDEITKEDSTTKKTSKIVVEKDTTKKKTTKTTTKKESTITYKKNTTTSKIIEDITTTKTTTTSKPVTTTEKVTTTLPTTTTTQTTTNCSKVFLQSWFRADFKTKAECVEMGNKYLNPYGYACYNNFDKCGEEYYMLRLWIEESDWIYYKDVEMPN